ncbi:integrin alpha-PS3 [Lutzomyia longipalpis]|uniref:integrin alpha-PS3 n=1 Tax=Lutzomyia longipalpis TaxID=7200 RepID=UPI002483C2C9|nr:integrin alpha-PS3 [Lutzomyia longipalpis]
MLNWCAFLAFLATCMAYNLSPTPNHIIQEPPQVTSFDPKKNQSSYFGYSINLRPDSILVGAPRAVARLESQRNVREPGAIYKCNIESSSCNLYAFDRQGNVVVEDDPIHSETKHEQWLGGAMDGAGSDEGKFVACASRNYITYGGKEYFLHGICYWVENTTDLQPQRTRKIAPLRTLRNQVIEIENEKRYFYMMAQSGISVHVTEDNEEILIGAVGLFNWKGTVIRYRTIKIDGNLSRRETSSLKKKRQTFNIPVSYTSDIPNPDTWQQPDDSYFGYSVGSGFFYGSGSGKLLYVAGAPRVDEVYLFDIVQQPGATETMTIQKFWTFHGLQFGEYFGATLLVEDFNGDELPDIAIGAPFHRTDEHDNGAVYVYLNQGKLQFTEDPIKLTSDYEMSGKFGTTLGKIGDINLDGFNDLAIGAPYEDEGAVYIYLGSKEGIQKKSVQKLTSPGGNPLFGYSISRGVDIDGNGYRDIAVGAPENELVFIYRTYPVVKVMASVNPQNRELDIGERRLKFNACYFLQSPTTFPSNVRLQLKLVADAQYERVKFPDDGKSSMEFEVTPQSYSQCKVFDVEVNSKTEIIFKPIDLEMSWKILDNIPQESEFCDHCVFLNPLDASYVRSQVVFNTGCKNTPCRADLRLSGTLQAPNPFILGTAQHLRAQYEVANYGETAYLPRITVQKSPSLNFMQILPNCHLDEDGDTMTCDLSTQPLLRGETRSIAFRFDPSSLDGSEFVITANVSSTGDEENPLDNTMDFTIPIQEFSTIEIVGRSSPQFVAIKDRTDQENLTHIFEFRNIGPTSLRSSQYQLIFDIPVSLLHRSRWVNFIHFSDIKTKITYKSYTLNVVWSQNDTILLQNPIEYSTSFPAIPDDLSGINYDSSKMGLDIPLEDPHQVQEEEDAFYRRRRDVESTSSFNPYTLAIRDEHPSSARSLDDAVFGSRINKTIFLDCNQIDVSCIRGTVVIPAALASKDPAVLVKITFPVHLEAINSVLDENRDSLLLRITPTLTKENDEQKKTIQITEIPSYTHFVQDIPQELQIWVIVVSVIGGILLLTIITYILYRLGFFKREKKAEIARLVRESQIQAAMESEDDD